MTLHRERWLLPSGVEELLPDRAQRVERLRRELLDRFHRWGYELVMPPLIEYLDSLLTGTGGDLDLHTFKLIDQATGRMLGVRADITPQAARIDAHRLQHSRPTRICYVGEVLHTQQDSLAGSRAPLQIGAELFGHSGVESDVEVLRLLLETLAVAQIPEIHIDLGHVDIFDGLVEQAELSNEDELTLFTLLQGKAIPEIRQLLDGLGVATPIAEMIIALPQMSGDEQRLPEFRERLAAAPTAVHAALDHLERVVALLAQDRSDATLHIDLAELRGYHYHTGLVFAAFIPGQGREIARGGRYDGVGEVFGRNRPATGFSADLIQLESLGEPVMAQSSAIFAPWTEDPTLLEQVSELRSAGERVISALPGSGDSAALYGCDRTLEKQANGVWQVVEVSA